MKLLHAVDKHKPYMATTGEALAAKWALVKKQTCPNKDVDVAARFVEIINKFRNGSHYFGPQGSAEFELVAKLSKDKARCERLGFPEEPAQTTEGPAENHQGDECHRGTREGLRPKRRRESSERGDGDDDPSPRPRRRARKSSAAPPPRREIDAASDEQFVDALAEYAPHLAKTSRAADAAWESIGDALPVGNALWGRNPQGLKMRYYWLKRWMTSASPVERRKLTPELTEKLQAYVARIGPPPCAVDEEESAPPASSQEETAPEEVASETGGIATDIVAAAIAFTAHVEKNVHREMMHLQDIVQSTAMKRLGEAAQVLKKLIKQDKRKTTARGPAEPSPGEPSPYQPSTSA